MNLQAAFPENHPDKELLKLGDQLFAGRRSLNSADDLVTSCTTLFEEKAPMWPFAAHVRRRDNILFRGRLPEFNFGSGAAYTIGQIETLARAPIYRNKERHPTEDEKAKNRLGDSDVIVTRVPWPRAQRRADEIVAALAAHRARSTDIAREVGLLDASAELDRLHDEETRVLEQIIDAPVCGLAGLVIKAIATEHVHDQYGDPDEEYIETLAIRSLLKAVMAVATSDVEPNRAGAKTSRLHEASAA